MTQPPTTLDHVNRHAIASSNNISCVYQARASCCLAQKLHVQAHVDSDKSVGPWYTYMHSLRLTESDLDASLSYPHNQ